MVSDGQGRPLTVFLSPGRMGDAEGALVLPASLPPAKRLLGDEGHIESAFARRKDRRGIAMRLTTRRGKPFLPTTALAAKGHPPDGDGSPEPAHEPRRMVSSH